MVLLNGLAVALGATVGGLARYGIAEFAGTAIGPWHIAGINVAGAAVLGAVAADDTLSPRTKLLLGVGACGAFTTFSTYAVDIVLMCEAQQFAKAAGYVAANNVGAVGSAWGGFKARKAILGAPKAKLPGSVRRGA